MGTNFYAVKIPSVQDYQEMQKALTNHQLNKLRELIDSSSKEYHIGKRSAGWQFIFESRQSGAPWEDDTLEAIKEFLNRSDIRIKDEYGTCFEPKIFWDEEVGPSLYHDENHMNGEDHDEKDPQHTSYYRHFDVEFTNEGIRFSKSDFC